MFNLRSSLGLLNQDELAVQQAHRAITQCLVKTENVHEKNPVEILNSLTAAEKDNQTIFIYVYLVSLLIENTSSDEANWSLFFKIPDIQSGSETGFDANPVATDQKSYNDLIKDIETVANGMSGELERKLSWKDPWQFARICLYQILSVIIALLYALGCGLSILGSLFLKFFSPIQNLAGKSALAQAILPSFVISSSSTSITNFYMVYQDIMDYFFQWEKKWTQSESQKKPDKKEESWFSFAVDVLNPLVSLISAAILAFMTWSYMSALISNPHLAFLSPAAPALGIIILVIGVGTFLSEYMLTASIFPDWKTLWQDIQDNHDASGNHQRLFKILFTLGLGVITLGMVAVLMVGVHCLQGLAIGAMLPSAIPYVLLGISVVAQSPLYIKSAAVCIKNLLTFNYASLFWFKSHAQSIGRFFQKNWGRFAINWVVGAGMVIGAILVTMGLGALPLITLIPAVIGIGFAYSLWLTKIQVNRTASTANNAIGNGLLPDSIEGIPNGIDYACSGLNSFAAGKRSENNRDEKARRVRDRAFRLFQTHEKTENQSDTFNLDDFDKNCAFTEA